MMLGSFLCCFGLLQASFKTWAVGRFFAGRAGLFVNAFLLLGTLSILTVLASFFGRGKRRVIGLAASVVTIFGAVLVFWINP
jgi:hypothetical protein